MSEFLIQGCLSGTVPARSAWIAIKRSTTAEISFRGAGALCPALLFSSGWHLLFSVLGIAHGNHKDPGDITLLG